MLSHSLARIRSSSVRQNLIDTSNKLPDGEFIDLDSSYDHVGFARADDHHIAIHGTFVA